MTRIFCKIYFWLRDKPLYKVIGASLVVLLLISIFRVIVINSFFDSSPIINDRNELLIIFSAVLFAPLFETTLFQMIIIGVIQSLFVKTSKWILVLCSALPFGLLHYENMSYMIFGFLGGCVFAYLYVIRDSRKKKSDAFLSVYLTHLIWNSLCVGMHILTS